jgi:hypothetical protein
VNYLKFNSSYSLYHLDIQMLKLRLKGFVSSESGFRCR